MFAVKFIYDLTGRPEPPKNELEEETDRLLYLKGAEQATHLAPDNLDSEVLGFWIQRRFEPALILLLLGHEDNNQQAKADLVKMERYTGLVDRLLRPKFVENYAMQRIKELCFEYGDNLKLSDVVIRLKKTLNFISKHLDQNNPHTLTLQGADAYTSADIILYSYLKRIMVGKYNDHGLKSHLRLCEPLIKFMSRYASKNTYVVNITEEDPLADANERPSLMTDITKSALVATGVLLFFLWRIG